MSNNIEEDIKIVEELLKDFNCEEIEYTMLFREKSKSIENILNTYKKNQNIVDEIRGRINTRQFELQQEYKEFKDDIRLNTLQEIYYMFVEDK